MQKFLRVSNLLKTEDVELTVNMRTGSSSFDILQFQPKSKILYSSQKGIFSNGDGYVSKVKTFLNLARDKKAALVITPEGAIPYEVIFDVLMDPSKWPEKRNLWCLSSEGMALKQYRETVEKLSKLDYIELIHDNDITPKQHINSLWYLFKISSKKIGVVVQLKQKPMLDRNARSELTDLSVGSTIFILDLNKGADTKNILFSLICADAIQLSMKDIVSNIEFTYPLVINPQLNPKPFASRFIAFRSSFYFEKNISKQRLITANWSCGTIINDEEINESGSCYYNYMDVNGKSHIDALVKDAEQFKHRSECYKNGVASFCEDNTYNIWSFGDKECVIHYLVKKDEVFGQDLSMGIQFDPVIKDKYYYDSRAKIWVGTSSCDCSNCNLMFFSDSCKDNPDYLPMKYEECINGDCLDDCQLLFNDFFFGITLGDMFKGEIQTKREVSNRTLFPLNKKSLANTNKKRAQFRRLIKLLSKNMLPPALCIFKNNHMFEIDFNAAITGSDRMYNVSVRKTNVTRPCWNNVKGIFIIRDTEDITEVEKLYNKLEKKVNKEYAEQILIFYQQDSEDVFYDVPYKNKKFTKSNYNFSSKISSFIEGIMPYEK